jgi:hypothetical protein
VWHGWGAVACRCCGVPLFGHCRCRLRADLLVHSPVGPLAILAAVGRCLAPRTSERCLAAALVTRAIGSDTAGARCRGAISAAGPGRGRFGGFACRPRGRWSFCAFDTRSVCVACCIICSGSRLRERRFVSASPAGSTEAKVPEPRPDYRTPPTARAGSTATYPVSGLPTETGEQLFRVRKSPLFR